MNRHRFPVVLKRIGVPVIVATWMLAGRLAWEQTVWSWEHGPQMVGFSLMHSGLGALLLLGVLAGLLWPVAVLMAALFTRSLGGRAMVAQLAAYALAWGVLTAPYGFWQRLFISEFSPEYSVEFLGYAAASGDLRTVKAFLAHGVNINAQRSNGTALHSAAAAGELEMVDYLIRQGADVNTVNPYGDSPLAVAEEAQAHRTEVQAILSSHGGIVIHGTAEQRERVIGEQVRRDIDHGVTTHK
jgi:hypothetical protein